MSAPAAPSQQPPPPGSPGPRWPLWALPVLFLLAALPPILAGNIRGRGAYDSVNYHEKVIRTFIAQWPHPDVSNYLSATTPGYHLVLAAVGRYLSDSDPALQLTGDLFTLALLALLAWACVRSAGAGGARLALVACLPLACSVNMFNAGVWLLPDNAGWLGVLWALLLALRERRTWRMAVAGGLVVALLVLFRQIHIWTAAPLLAAAWLGCEAVAPARDSEPSAGELLTTDLPRRAARVALALACLVPAMVVLMLFARLWGGLTPPCFRSQYGGGFNAATPALVLALLGAFSVFYSPFLVPAANRLRRRHRWALPGATAAGGLCAILVPTSFDNAAGRSGGPLWNLVNKFPALADRSPLMAVLAALGGAALLLWMASLRWRDRWILLAALAAFTLAQASGHWAYQRYVEPMVLILLALMVCRIEPRPGGPSPAWRLAGPAVLGAILGAGTLINVTLSPPVRDEGFTLTNLPLPGQPNTPPAQAAPPVPRP